MTSIRKKLLAAWSRLGRLARLDDRVAEATHAASVAAARLETLSREHRLLARQVTLPPAEIWASGPQPAPSPATARVTDRAAVCRQDSFETAWFAGWMTRFGYAPRYHRKLWEYAFICQALEDRGVLRPGARGLGFGVGNEPLSACFASRECRILATDMAPEAQGASGWSGTGQYAFGKETLRMAGVCPDHLFDQLVEFRTCDMNAIPGDLTGFDFCWSACSLEHLGSLDAGLSFVERAMDCLGKGGIAVHTTELNLNADTDTIASGPTVLYRRQDLNAFANRMHARGYAMAPFDFDAGSRPLDRYVDFPPYLNEPHLRLAIEGYPSTSVAIIITKP